MFTRNAWYMAAWSSEIEEKPLARMICGDPIVLFRDKQGLVGALEDKCCHRGAPLSMGQVVEGGLECGYHGLVHDRAGRCVHIPAQDRIPKKAQVRSYPVVEKDEIVWLWTGDPETADESEILDYPYHNDHEKWPHKPAMCHIKGSYRLMVENLMDLSHVGYVHKTTIGGNPTSHVDAKMEVTRTEKGLKFVRWLLNSTPPTTYVKAVGFKGKIDRWQEFEFVPPSNVVQWSGGVDVTQNAYETGDREGGFSLRLFHALTPETETTCFYFYCGCNGYRQDDPQATEDLYQQLNEAFVEDKAFVEGQQARLTHFGEDDLVDIVSDRARLALRRIMDDQLQSEREARDPELQWASQ